MPDLRVDEQEAGEVEEDHRDRGVSPPSFHPPYTRRILSKPSPSVLLKSLKEDIHLSSDTNILSFYIILISTVDP